MITKISPNQQKEREKDFASITLRKGGHHSSNKLRIGTLALYTKKVSHHSPIKTGKESPHKNAPINVQT